MNESGKQRALEARLEEEDNFVPLNYYGKDSLIFIRRKQACWSGFQSEWLWNIKIEIWLSDKLKKAIFKIEKGSYISVVDYGVYSWFISEQLRLLE